MPDMQTALRSALTKTLQTWDDDGEEAPSPSVQPVSTSVSAPSQNIQGIPMTKDHTMLNLHKITNNVSRVTFNYIRDNPGSKRQEIIIALEHAGYPRSSVAALISQMNKAKLIHKTNELWYADVDEYQPIKTADLARNRTKLTVPVTKKAKAPPPAPASADAGIAALRPDTTAQAEAPAPKHFLTRLVRTQSPEDIIGNMTVYQARELYDHLKKLFGG